MTLNQDFHDGMIAAASGSEWCDTAICTDCDDETTAANGAYVQYFSWTIENDNGTPASTPYVEYLPTAAASLESGITDFIDISGGSDKYGFSADPAWSSSDAEAFIVDYTWGVTFYMPAEPADIPDGETTATGDRLNKGDDVFSWSGGSGGAVPLECNDGAKLTLGAKTLAAGSLALAAAILY